MTEIAVWPVTVTQIKTVATDGYEAVQVAAGEKRGLTKPLLGHLRGKKFRYLKEFKMPITGLSVDVSWGAGVFEVGEKVKVVGTSKGKGFQGPVKRWGFSGGRASHGNKDQLRTSGSVGAGGPAHVFKGIRMAGHTGADQVTAKWLEIVKVDPEQNVIFVKGAIPGAHNGVVYITSERELDLSTQPVTPIMAAGDEVKNSENVEVKTPEVATTEVKETVAEITPDSSEGEAKVEVEKTEEK